MRYQVIGLQQWRTEVLPLNHRHECTKVSAAGCSPCTINDIYIASYEYLCRMSK